MDQVHIRITQEFVLKSWGSQPVEKSLILPVLIDDKSYEFICKESITFARWQCPLSFHTAVGVFKTFKSSWESPRLSDLPCTTLFFRCLTQMCDYLLHSFQSVFSYQMESCILSTSSCLIASMYFSVLGRTMLKLLVAPLWMDLQSCYLILVSCLQQVTSYSINRERSHMPVSQLYYNTVKIVLFFRPTFSSYFMISTHTAWWEDALQYFITFSARCTIVANTQPFAPLSFYARKSSHLGCPIFTHHTMLPYNA